MADTYYTFKDFSGEAINELLQFIAALKNNEINIVVNGGDRKSVV